MKNIFYSATTPVLHLETELCVGCGLCGVVCPNPVFTVDTKASVINVDQCIGCGACAANCPVGALTLTPAEGSGPLLIRGLWSKICGRKAELSIR